MAMWQAIWFSLATLSLVFPSDASFTGSGGGIESGQVYLVASELSKCPVNTTCDTLSSYSTMDTTGVCDVIFSFLPGTHKLYHTWIISDSNSVTIRGESNNAEEENETSYVAEIICVEEFSDWFAIIVNNSKQVLLESIKIADCPWSISLDRNNITTVVDVNIVCSSIHQDGLEASDGGRIAIKNSTFTNCAYPIMLDQFQYIMIEDIVSINNAIGLILTNFMEVEVSESYFLNNSVHSIWVVVSQGNVTFKQIFTQGSEYPIYVFVPQLDFFLEGPMYTISVIFLDCTVRMERESIAGIYIGLDHQRLNLFLQSVTVTGAPGSGLNGIIIDSLRASESLAQIGRVRIDNVTIENINTYFSLHEARLSPSALLVVSVKNLTISDCTIQNNGVTGIFLYDTTAFLQGIITLINNSGINGGGMSVVSNSFILFDSSTNLELSDNFAAKFGGGIYVSQYMLWLPPSQTAFSDCFAFSIGEGSNTIIFSGNRADDSGHDLYGGSLNNCRLPTFNDQMTYYVASVNVDQGSGNCNQTEISSDPVRVLLCNEYCVDDSKNSSKQYKFPGQDFSVRIAAVGQLNGLTPAIILFSSNDIVLGETSPNMSQSIDTKRIDGQCTNVTIRLQLRESINEAIVNITIADETLPNFVNKPIEVCVVVKPCPPGFFLSNGVCGCTNSIQDLASCNITSESIQRNGNSWIYPRNDSIMIFNNCPFDYCNNDPFTSYSADDQCMYNRSGILCGQCIPGYSLMLGSNECQNCMEQVWQLPLIVLCSVLIGIGLVAVLIAINLTVSVGTMNGLIFFVNIVKIYEPIFVTNTFHPILRYFISWLNLDLGITSCFIPGMTACVKVGLQFVFPLYLLSIFSFIIVICKVGQWPVFSSIRIIGFVSGKVTLLISSNAIPVLATILLLSYTKLLRTTILITHKATIITTDCDENTSLSNCENFTVWYVDGNITYASKCHGILFGVAVGISMPLVVLFTSFLLFFPLMERYLPRIKCWSSWHMRLKPWYDAYGGPYKDEYRLWTGMMLLVRCVLALVVSFNNDPFVNRSVLAWVCFFLISLLSLIQVYKSSLLTSLELLYLVSLLLMIFFSSADYQQMDAVLSVVFCSFLFIVSYHIYHQVVKLKRIQRLMENVKIMIKHFRINSKKRKNDHNCNTNDSTGTSTLVTTKGVQYTELREPLLEEEL